MTADGIQNDPRRWWALGAISFGLFMALLDITVVNVALPAIQRGVHASFNSLEWVVNAYALPVAVLLITSSRLGDLMGRKRVFLGGMAVFTLGSLSCAVSAHLHIDSLSRATVLNLSRALQGVGGSAMLPLSLSLITATFHGRERGTAFGIWGGVSGLALAVGPLVGGLLVAKVGWPSIFYLNVPTGILGIILGTWAIHDSRDQRAGRHIDVYGLVTLTVSLFCLVLALMKGNDKGWHSAYILTLFIVGGVALAAFIIGELLIKSPMLNPRLFASPTFTGAAVAVFMLSAGLYALFFYLSLYMQNYLGYDALQTGLRFLPLSALVLVTAPVAGRMSDRISPKWILSAGLAFILAGLLLLTRLGHAVVAADWTMLLPGLILAGLGNGMVNPPISTLAMGSVDPRYIGMASGTNNVARQTGVAFGIAAEGAFLANRYRYLVRRQIMHLAAPLSHGARLAIVRAIRQAGPIAGSEGLRGASRAYRANPLFPTLVTVARHAFLLGTRDTVWLAALLIAVGLAATLTLVRSRDAVHHQHAPSVNTADPSRTALILALAAAWEARDGARPGASLEQQRYLRDALNLLALILNQKRRG